MGMLRRKPHRGPDEAEARRLIQRILPTVAAGETLDSVCFHFGDDVACYLIYVNLPMLQGRDDDQLAQVIADNEAGRWHEGAREVLNEFDPEQEDGDFEPYFIELGDEAFIRDPDDAYATAMPFMYRVCAWLERILRDPEETHDLTVSAGFRALANRHDSEYEDIDVDLRASAADLGRPLDDFLDEYAGDPEQDDEEDDDQDEDE